MLKSFGQSTRADLLPRLSVTHAALWMTVLRWLFGAMLILVVLPSGASEGTVLHVLAPGFFALAVVVSVFAADNPKIRPAYQIALWSALVLGLWIVAQSLGFAGNPLANPVWKDAAENFGPMPAAISVAPGDTLQGVIAALLPFAVFLTVLLLFPSDDDALWLVRLIAVSGAVICLIGLVQFLLFPDALLFARKEFYLDSLTTVFVNRNTAATYIAMVAVLSAGLAYHHLQNAGVRSFARYLIGAPNPTRHVDAMRIVGYGAALLLALLCLMLTRSRAGIASGLSGLFLMAAILASSGYSRRRGSRGQYASIGGKAGRIVLILGVVVLIGLTFAGQAILRAGAQGATDLRFCFLPSLLEMARDNWLFGTGFATFPDVFPAYRNPACGMDGVLVMAHNFYLEGVITLGLPFVMIAILLVVALAVLLIEGVRHRRRFRWLPATALAILLLQMMHNSVDFSIQNPGVAVTTAALLGAAIVVARGRLPGQRKRSAGSGLAEPAGSHG